MPEKMRMGAGLSLSTLARMAVTPAAWTPASWRSRPARHLPSWPEPEAAEGALAQLRALPPLVFAGEARDLRAALGEVAAGKAFLLQAGDCAESFRDFTAVSIREKLKILLQMSIVLIYGSTLPLVKVGRIAGQFAKPRSEPTESVDGVELPSFFGHMVNDDLPDPAARRLDPDRMVRAYHQSAATLNLLRAFTKGGFADLTQVQMWNQAFAASAPEGQRYAAVAAEIERALGFMRACGVDLVDAPQLHQVDVWTSHEGLVLDYEEGLTRQDSLTGDWYDCSAHMLWIGDRTRDPDGAHVDFFAGVHNPLGVKLGPSATPQEVVALCERDADQPVVWACDPMHANVFRTASGIKTRSFDAIMREIGVFFATCRAAGAWPGGVHLEFTGEDVTECLGGSAAVLEEQLTTRYESLCDPRLNARQALDLAFRVAELMRT
jgi:3-deoxy-7-phosphoheptulonate synthase